MDHPPEPDDLAQEQAAALADAHVTVTAQGDAGASGLDLTQARIRDYGVRPFALLFILNAVDEFDRSVLAVGLEPIIDEFGVSDFVASLLPMAFIFIAGIVGVPAGTWADRWLRTRILAIGAVIWAGAGVAAAAAQSFLQLFVTRAFLGVGRGTADPTHLSLLSDYYPAKLRGRVLGYHRAANPAGQVLGAILGGALIASLGWRWAFVIVAIPGFVFGLLVLTLREPTRGGADLESSGAAVDNPLLTEFLKEPAETLGFRESLRIVMRTPTLRNLVLANASLGFALIGVVFWLPPFFERFYDYSTTQAALVLGVLAFSAFIGTFRGSSLADRNLRRGWRYLATYGTRAIMTVAVAWPLAFVIGSAPLAIVLLSGSALYASLGVPGLVAIVAAVSPPRIRSQAFAVFGLALSVCGAALAPVVIGLISDILQGAGMDDGNSLRWALASTIPVVMLAGTWCVWRASRTAEDDVQRTLTDFLGELASRGERSD